MERLFENCNTETSVTAARKNFYERNIANYSLTATEMLYLCNS